MNTSPDQVEAKQIRAFVLGSLAGSVPQMALVQPVEVIPYKDGEGNYVPYFDIKLASGIVLRVGVEIQHPVQETVGLLPDGTIGIVPLDGSPE